MLRSRSCSCSDSVSLIPIYFVRFSVPDIALACKTFWCGAVPGLRAQRCSLSIKQADSIHLQANLCLPEFHHLRSLYGNK